VTRGPLLDEAAGRPTASSIAEPQKIALQSIGILSSLWRGPRQAPSEHSISSRDERFAISMIEAVASHQMAFKHFVLGGVGETDTSVHVVYRRFRGGEAP